MRPHSIVLIALLSLGAFPALAQDPPAPNAAPPAAEAAPDAASAPAPQAQSSESEPKSESKPATPAQPQSPATGQPSPAPAAPAAPTGRATLFPNQGDPANVDEGLLTAKPAAILQGTSIWDEGFAKLKEAFAKIEDELKKAGIAPAGRPLTLFVHTDDQGFRFEAMVPVTEVPDGKSELTPEIKFGKTPEGKAFRFVHKDAYDEIDGTYETITAYLDAKNIESKDAFIEEYLTDLTESQDTGLEVNIYVQPKE